MEDAKINTTYVNAIVECMESLIENMQDDIKKMKDQDGDIFEKFMACNRSDSLIQFAKLAVKKNLENMASGHLISHKVLQTPAALENDWDKVVLSNHPFFRSESDDKEAMFIDILKSIIKGK